MVIQLLALALLATVSLVLFFLVNSADGPMRESRYTRYIPFIPAFVVPYLGLFPYVAFSMLTLLFFTPVGARF